MLWPVLICVVLFAAAAYGCHARLPKLEDSRVGRLAHGITTGLLSAARCWRWRR